MKRHLFTLFAAATAACALALPATADPGHARNATHVQAICGTQTVNVVVSFPATSRTTLIILAFVLGAIAFVRLKA